MVPALPHRDVALAGYGVELKGWLFPASAPSRGVTVVYLHGVADNRASGVWIAERLVGSGYDVLAYDGRAHGDSGGDACTYGYYEKRDLSRVLDQLGATRVVLVGASLGAAVALQAAAEDRRVIGVAAAAVFSDLATIARERARWFATGDQIAEALALAEREARFVVTEVSPVAAAPRIRAPVLLVHGERDGKTSPEHSRRVLAALGGPRRLAIVPGAGHDDALGKAWSDVARFIDEVSGGTPASTSSGPP
jgi:pimeloyl-ACP methyl ester carboxylesterase